MKTRKTRRRWGRPDFGQVEILATHPPTSNYSVQAAVESVECSNAYLVNPEVQRFFLIPGAILSRGEGLK
jgi:hypothetical protein